MPTPHLARLIASAVCLLAAPLVRADDPAERERLLAEARDGNRQALAAIRTLSLDFDLQVIKGDTELPIERSDVFAPAGRGLYRQSETTYRLLSARGIDKLISDMVARNGRAFGVTKPGVNSAWSFFSGTAPIKERLWIWEYLLLSHPAPSGESSFAFDTLLGERYAVSAVERTEDSVRVQLTHPAGKLDLHFSPKHNWMVRKRVWDSKVLQLRYQAEVTEFAEPRPGVYLPRTVAYRTSGNGELQELRQLNVTNIVVNQPIPPEQLQIPELTEMIFGSNPYSSGYTDLNWVPGSEPRRSPLESYQVDADGYVIPRPRPKPEPPPRQVIPYGINDFPVAGMVSQNPDPPERQLAPWWVWGIVSSLGVVVIAAGLEIQRLRKQVRALAPPGSPPTR